MNERKNLYCRAWQYLFEIVTVAKNDCILTDSDRGRCQRTFLRPKRHADPERDDHCRNRYTDPAFPIVEDWIRTADRCNAQICGTGVPVINSAFCSIGSTWYYQSLILMCIKSPIRFSLYP